VKYPLDPSAHFDRDSIHFMTTADGGVVRVTGTYGDLHASSLYPSVFHGYARHSKAKHVVIEQLMFLFESSRRQPEFHDPEYDRYDQED